MHVPLFLGSNIQRRHIRGLFFSRDSEAATGALVVDGLVPRHPLPER